MQIQVCIDFIRSGLGQKLLSHAGRIVSLSRILAKYFSPSIQSRGRAYAQAGRVKNLRIQKDGSITASVKGSELYSVALVVVHLSRERAKFFGGCDCPYAESSVSCKHLWAMLLEADQQSIGNRFSQLTSAELQTIFEQDFDDEVVAFEDEFFEEESITKQNLAWEEFLSLLQRGSTRALPLSPPSPAVLTQKQIWFAIEPGLPSELQVLCLRIYFREPLKNGKWSKLKASVPTDYATALSEDPGEKIVHALRREFDAFQEINSFELEKVSRLSPLQGFLIPLHEAAAVLRAIAEAGRLTIRATGEKKPRDEALFYHHECSYELEGRVEEWDKKRYILKFYLIAQGQELAVEDAILLASGRLMLIGRVLSPCFIQNQGLQNLIGSPFIPSNILIEKKNLQKFLDQYQFLPDTPPLKLPRELNLKTEVPEPQPLLCLFPESSTDYIAAELSFIYPFGQINYLESQQHWIFKKQNIKYSRFQRREESFYQQLIGCPGFVLHSTNTREETGKIGLIANSCLVGLIETLEASSWHIQAEGKRVCVPSNFETIVEGTIDWIDISIAAEIDGENYRLPELLRQKNPTFISLGSKGLAVLPEKWLKQLEILRTNGRLVNGTWRFPSQQAILVDAMLRDQPVVSKSKVFSRIRERMKTFEQRQELPPAEGFQGKLRSYQMEGLAWLSFLKEFQLGGCLADDMGLGKTIQVLALLWNHYQDVKNSDKPSLVVVPRSLVGNWLKEAKTFCPELSFVDHSQASRNWSSLSRKTIYVTTYGVLRQDVVEIAERSFVFAVLDESQTVKNSSSLTAKAVRTLKADHRLAMSGTPVENHLGEIASLITFLNPGLLESASWKNVLQKGVRADDSRLEILKNALRPLFLRRTKEQVLKDLPPKIEQTLECDMEPEQARLYQELLNHYRLQLLPSLQEETWRSSSLVILEALLRLRQAACHPGLVDKRFADTSSSKINLLLERLTEVVSSGHKALVFSQFTSLLKILGKSLEKLSIPFEYLDGKTRRREAIVDRFQNDPKLPVFLISLKAGGVGLNLTAADYCFILDPWWNPAAEAQAIDRAHRIHQTKTVFAYRLISKGTIEEKIQQLQKSKRNLAQAVLEENGSVLQSLSLDAVRDIFA